MYRKQLILHILMLLMMSKKGRVFLRFCLVYTWIIYLCSKSRVPLPHRFLNHTFKDLSQQYTCKSIMYCMNT